MLVKMDYDGSNLLAPMNPSPENCTKHRIGS